MDSRTEGANAPSLKMKNVLDRLARLLRREFQTKPHYTIQVYLRGLPQVLTPEISIPCFIEPRPQLDVSDKGATSTTIAENLIAKVGTERGLRPDWLKHDPDTPAALRERPENRKTRAYDCDSLHVVLVRRNRNIDAVNVKTDKLLGELAKQLKYRDQPCTIKVYKSNLPTEITEETNISCRIELQNPQRIPGRPHGSTTGPEKAIAKVGRKHGLRADWLKNTARRPTESGNRAPDQETQVYSSRSLTLLTVTPPRNKDTRPEAEEDTSQAEQLSQRGLGHSQAEVRTEDLLKDLGEELAHHGQKHHINVYMPEIPKTIGPGTRLKCYIKTTETETAEPSPDTHIVNVNTAIRAVGTKHGVNPRWLDHAGPSPPISKLAKTVTSPVLDMPTLKIDKVSLTVNLSDPGDRDDTERRDKTERGQDRWYKYPSRRGEIRAPEQANPAEHLPVRPSARPGARQLQGRQGSRSSHPGR